MASCRVVGFASKFFQREIRKKKKFEVRRRGSTLMMNNNNNIQRKPRKV
jgi:hypothetical protein